MLAGLALAATSAFAVSSVPVHAAAAAPVSAEPARAVRAVHAVRADPFPGDYEEFPWFDPAGAFGPSFMGTNGASGAAKGRPDGPADPESAGRPGSAAVHAAQPIRPAAKPQGRPAAEPKGRPAARPRAHRPAGKAVDLRAVQLRLKKLHYVPGPANGAYTEFTKDAVWAFQKVNGMAPTGRLSRRFMHALAHPRRPRRLTADRTRNHVDIDVRHQVLTVYRGGRIRMISHISTGSGRHYCEKGHCGIAHTPIGDFRVTHRVNGWQRSPLGYMYRPLYFHLGYAMHGSLAVPNRRASHGCIRLPMNAGDALPHMVRNGEPVHVH
ncbi:L,D-transpeptidase family protein [Actinomadura harenae]|uniref:Murein L,D-transpeptidase n=1 Tax=Actinomadura harenae TaxID=2483351 RepID=A0A3M2LSI3_9ACTN|nr:L,D-transpeptidase family protein [Actinomadura harenae]RMI40357.1 murein L,D-transpeptidase [Actinomadura harenae]